MTDERSLLIRLIEAVLRPEGVVIAHEADRLEATHGDRAIEWVRQRILTARKAERRRLYRLHDEIARRHAEPLSLDAALASLR